MVTLVIVVTEKALWDVSRCQQTCPSDGVVAGQDSVVVSFDHPLSPGWQGHNKQRTYEHGVGFWCTSVERVLTEGHHQHPEVLGGMCLQLNPRTSVPLQYILPPASPSCLPVALSSGNTGSSFDPDNTRALPRCVHCSPYCVLRCV